MPFLDLENLLQVPRWRGISTEGHILIVIMIINPLQWLYLYLRSLLLVFLACFLVSARIPYRCVLPGIQSVKGLEDLTIHLLRYGYLAWGNSPSSILTRLNILG